MLFGEVVESLGGGVFLEEVHCCSQALWSVSSLNLVPVHLFGFVFEVEDVIFQLCPPPLSQDLLLATMPLPPQLILTPLQLQSKTNPFFRGCFVPAILSHQQKSNYHRNRKLTT